MRLRTLLMYLLVLIALLPVAGCGSATPTEARAIASARNDHSAYTLSPEKLSKAVEISRLYDTMYFAAAAWGMLALWLILEFGIAARMRSAALHLSGSRWIQCFAFACELLLLTTLLNLPLRVYAHRASVGFGFSVQHWRGWLLDQAKNFLLVYMLGSLFVLLLFFLIRKFPPRWWLWLWFPTMVAVLFGVYLAPLLVDPLFNRFQPLNQTNPALVQQIETLARHGSIDIPPERMYLMNASEKTPLLNAYVTGFGSSKRLVIWDTLLTRAAPDEILIIVGHEMGHYVLRHIVRGILVSFAGILLAFFAGFHLFQSLLRRFGPRWQIQSQDDWAALVIMLLVLQILTFFSAPIQNSFSRAMEHDADVFGQEAVHGIVSDPQATGQAAEQMLGESFYADPNPPALVEFWTDSHPSTPFRAAFARHYNPWAPGEAPKYFTK